MGDIQLQNPMIPVHTPQIRSNLPWFFKKKTTVVDPRGVSVNGRGQHFLAREGTLWWYLILYKFGYTHFHQGSSGGTSEITFITVYAKMNVIYIIIIQKEILSAPVAILNYYKSKKSTCTCLVLTDDFTKE